MKYSLVISPVEAFSFLAAVKDVIVLPPTDVSLNTGAEFAVTSMYSVWFIDAPKESVAFTGT